MTVVLSVQPYPYIEMLVWRCCMLDMTLLPWLERLLLVSIASCTSELMYCTYSCIAGANIEMRLCYTVRNALPLGVLYNVN